MHTHTHTNWAYLCRIWKPVELQPHNQSNTNIRLVSDVPNIPGPFDYRLVLCLWTWGYHHFIIKPSTPLHEFALYSSATDATLRNLTRTRGHKLNHAYLPVPRICRSLAHSSRQLIGRVAPAHHRISSCTYSGNDIRRICSSLVRMADIPTI